MFIFQMTTSELDQITEIGDFRLYCTLNKDNSTSVFSSYYPNTNHKIAIKLINKNNPDYARFKRGMDILSTVRIPNILNQQQTIETKDYYGIVFAYAFNGDVLNYMIYHGTFSEKDMQGLMRCLLTAVHGLHQMGIIHNQLRVESFLLLNDDNEPLDVVISSFGSAMREDDDMLFIPDPTDPYIAPELIDFSSDENQETKEIPKATKATDIYSLGVSFYQMFTGMFPYEFLQEGHETYFEGEKWEKSPLLSDLLAAMLVDNPEERHTADKLLHHPFFTESEGDQSLLYVDRRRLFRESVIPITMDSEDLDIVGM